MEIEGLGNGRDFKLFPGGGRSWDWSETGTHHVPGIQIADLEELIDHGSRVVVLSRGMELALQTCPNALQYLREKGIRTAADLKKLIDEEKAAGKEIKKELVTQLQGHIQAFYSPPSIWYHGVFYPSIFLTRAAFRNFHRRSYSNAGDAFCVPTELLSRNGYCSL